MQPNDPDDIESSSTSSSDEEEEFSSDTNVEATADDIPVPKIETEDAYGMKDSDSTISNTSKKEGWLWKKHRKNKLWTGWHRRYFVMEDGKLEYYRKPRKNSKQRPIGTINISSGCRVEFSRRPAGKHDFYEFMIHTEDAGIFMLAAITEKQVQDWIDVIDEQIANGKVDGIEGDGSNPLDGENGVDESFPEPPRSPSRSPGVIKQGFLYRRHPKGRILNSWHKRYFVLFSTGKLEWYRMDYKRVRAPRGHVMLNSEFSVDFSRTLKKTKKTSFSPFTIMSDGKVKLQLGGETLELAEEWVTILNALISGEKIENKLPTEEESTPRPRSASGAKRRNRLRVSNHSISEAESIPIDLNNNSLDETNQQIDMEGELFKKYAFRRKLSTGWHKRYFVLRGNRLEYFKDSRKRKSRGSILLGSDCVVDFPRTTTVRAGHELYPFSIFAESKNQDQVWNKEAVLMGCPSREEAEKWVVALQLAIYTQQGPACSSVMRDQDEEEDDDEDEAIDPRNMQRQFNPMDMEDGSRLWIRTTEGSEPLIVDGTSEPAAPGVVQCIAVVDALKKSARLIKRNATFGMWLPVGPVSDGEIPVVIISDNSNPTGIACQCRPPEVKESTQPGKEFKVIPVTKSRKSLRNVSAMAKWRYEGLVKVKQQTDRGRMTMERQLLMVVFILSVGGAIATLFGHTSLATVLNVLSAGLGAFLLYKSSSKPRESESVACKWSLKLTVLDAGYASGSPVEEEKGDRAELRGQQNPKKKKNFLAGSSGFRFLQPEKDDPDHTKIHYWSKIQHDMFKLRIGPDYKQNKLKGISERPLYNTWQMDIFQSERKVQEVTPNIEIPMETMVQLDRLQKAQTGSDKFIPPLLVVNLCVPMYPPANPVWGAKKDDGRSGNIFFYLMLDDWVLNDLDRPSVALWRRFFEAPNEDLAIKDRLKLITALANVDECNFSSVEAALERKFNGIPFLARPCHSCQDGWVRQTMEVQKGNPPVELACRFSEIFIDAHTFCYLARSTGWTVIERVQRMVINAAFVIEGHSNEELPEQVLGIAGVHKMNLLEADRWEERHTLERKLQ